MKIFLIILTVIITLAGCVPGILRDRGINTSDKRPVLIYVHGQKEPTFADMALPETVSLVENKYQFVEYIFNIDHYERREMKWFSSSIYKKQVKGLSDNDCDFIDEYELDRTPALIICGNNKGDNPTYVYLDAFDQDEKVKIFNILKNR